MVNYQTGEDLPLTPTLWVHGGLDFDYDPEAEAPRWEKYLDEIFNGDRESINCIEEQLGYGMTWDVRFDKAFLLCGKPSAGKSTVIWVLERLVGTELYAAVDLDDWRGANARAYLVGKKAVGFPDVRLKPAKAYGNVGYDPGGIDYQSMKWILQITGRDKMATGAKYDKHPWEGQLSLKIWMVFNEPPTFQDRDGAFAKRFYQGLVPSRVPGGSTRPGLAGEASRRASGNCSKMLAGISTANRTWALRPTKDLEGA
jgi:putative DNA primase/helicase